MKNSVTQILTIGAFVFITACGIDPTKLEGTSNKETDPTTVDSQLTNSSDSFVFEGYVSPINISVNGKSYRDSEDFYTQEVKRLKAEVAKNYPQHSLFFDADVGLRDFKQNLLVLLVATSETGVASESVVDGKGKFAFNLPSDIDKQQTYTIRASKRIGLRLVKDQEVISWCYNLFAQNDVTLDSKSIILRKFETVITSYQCEEDNTSSIEVPENPIKYVPEAFENADHYNGYGPYPKSKSVPVVTPAVDGQDVINTLNNP